MNKLFNGSFKSIKEVDLGDFVLSYIDNVLELINEIDVELTLTQSKEDVEAVLDLSVIKYCLSKCKLFIEGNEYLTRIDYFIYYDYAAIKAQEVDDVLQFG